MNIIKSIWVWFASIIFILLAFPITVLLWLLSLLFDPRRIMNNHWMLFQGIVLTYMNPIWKVTIEGREKINNKQTYVIVSNHQSMLDIVIFCVLRHPLRWVSKMEVFKVPLLGWSMKMVKYIGLERGNKHSVISMMDKCNTSLKEGVSIVLFPEGTRSRTGEIGKFKSGAFQLAIKNDKPILPVILDGTGDILPKKGLVFQSRRKVRIKVLDPVFPGQFGTCDPDELAAKMQKIMTEAHLEMRSSQ